MRLFNKNRHPLRPCPENTAIEEVEDHFGYKPLVAPRGLTNVYDANCDLSKENKKTMKIFNILIKLYIKSSFSEDNEHNHGDRNFR